MRYHSINWCLRFAHCLLRHVWLFYFNTKKPTTSLQPWLLHRLGGKQPANQGSGNDSAFRAVSISFSSLLHLSVCLSSLPLFPSFYNYWSWRSGSNSTPPAAQQNRCWEVFLPPAICSVGTSPRAQLFRPKHSQAALCIAFYVFTYFRSIWDKDWVNSSWSPYLPLQTFLTPLLSVV